MTSTVKSSFYQTTINVYCLTSAYTTALPVGGGCIDDECFHPIVDSDCQILEQTSPVGLGSPGLGTSTKKIFVSDWRKMALFVIRPLFIYIYIYIYIYVCVCVCV